MLMVLLQNSTKRGEKSLNLGLIVFIGLEIITGWGAGYGILSGISK